MSFWRKTPEEKGYTLDTFEITLEDATRAKEDQEAAGFSVVIEKRKDFLLEGSSWSKPKHTGDYYYAIYKKG